MTPAVLDLGTGAGVTVESPEFRLVAACCRWPASDARDGDIRAVAAEAIDWPLFLWLTRRHRVGGLVHQASNAARISIPSTIADALSAEARHIARRNLAAAAEAGRLQRLFDAAGIRSVVLKGAALAQLAYGSLTLKHARDIDFLLLPADAEIAFQILDNEGYSIRAPAQALNAAQRRALVRYGREAEFFRRADRLFVELQWRLTDNPLLLTGIDASSPTQDVAVPDIANIRTLTGPDLFAYLCAHGARHAWSRMKWLADVNALTAATHIHTSALYRHAQECGAGLCAAQALMLCRQLFGLKLPPDLASEAEADKRVKRLTAIALTAMTAPNTETEVDGGFAGVLRSVARQFLLGSGLPFLMAQIKASAVGIDDVVRLPLPRSLHFLYPLLRLPLWLWRRSMVFGQSRQKRVQTSTE